MRINRPVGVSIITCTNRPNYFDALIANFRRQRYREKELIIVVNKNAMKLSEYRRRVAGFSNIKVLKVPERFALGACLNYGIEAARYPIIAKFDDDDYYSPNYLLEQVRALHRTGAGIVGKSAHLKFLEGKRLLVITSPSLGNKFVRYVAGGTLMFRRQLHKRFRFASLTLGEDINFMQRCSSKGYKLYATSPYNFVGIRRKNKRSHTWKASDEELLIGSRFVARTAKYRKWADRPVT